MSEASKRNLDTIGKEKKETSVNCCHSVDRFYLAQYSALELNHCAPVACDSELFVCRPGSNICITSPAGATRDISVGHLTSQRRILFLDRSSVL